MGPRAQVGGGEAGEPMPGHTPAEALRGLRGIHPPAHPTWVGADSDPEGAQAHAEEPNPARDDGVAREGSEPDYPPEQGAGLPAAPPPATAPPPSAAPATPEAQDEAQVADPRQDVRAHARPPGGRTREDWLAAGERQGGTTPGSRGPRWDGLPPARSPRGRGQHGEQHDQARWRTWFTTHLWELTPDAAPAHGGDAGEEEAARELRTPGTPLGGRGYTWEAPGTSPRPCRARPLLQRSNPTGGRHGCEDNSPWHTDAGAPPP